MRKNNKIEAHISESGFSKGKRSKLEASTILVQQLLTRANAGGGVNNDSRMTFDDCTKRLAVVLFPISCAIHQDDIPCVISGSQEHIIRTTFCCKLHDRVLFPAKSEIFSIQQVTGILAYQAVTRNLSCGE